MRRLNVCLFASLLLAPLVLMSSGCATARLSLEGEKVLVSPTPPQEGCVNLGPVFGKGGGSFGGAFISDEKLMEYASNDVRNKAAKKGANVVVYSTHQMGMSGGSEGVSTPTATIAAVAYRCP